MSDQPAAFRAQVAMLKLLGWANGLEGFLTLLAGCWGMSTLIDPSPDPWVIDWQTHEWLLVTPVSLAAIMVVASTAGMLSLWRRWRWLRMQTSLIGFMVWGTLALYDGLIARNALTQDAVTHGLLAMAELGVYVRILVGLDQRTNQFGNMVSRKANSGE